MVGRIEYAIVALRLSPKDAAEIINDATGVLVDPEAAGFLQALDMSQLEAVWKRLSEDPRWQKRARSASG